MTRAGARRGDNGAKSVFLPLPGIASIKICAEAIALMYVNVKDLLTHN
jgi:hypothetical protein